MRMNAYERTTLQSAFASMVGEGTPLGLAISRERCNHSPEWESLTMVFHEISTLQDRAYGRLVAKGL
jgi:hypothetical protein